MKNRFFTRRFVSARCLPQSRLCAKSSAEMGINMYGIFMESVVIFKNYMGGRYLAVLFLLALAYLFAAEKDKKRRALFLYMPLSLLLLFFFPIFRKVFVRLMGDGDTYYRVLWLIPMGVITAYGAIKLVGRLYERKRAWAGRAVFAAAAALVVMGGKYVYGSQYMSKAENMYHLPQHVIDICDLIAPEEGEPRVWAVFPTDLVYFVRQYDTNIQLLYGREMDVIASCVIGGVSTTGGRGTVVGTLLGSLILAVIAKALPLVGIDALAQNTVKGVIILAVIILNVVTQRMMDRNNLKGREM